MTARNGNGEKQYLKMVTKSLFALLIGAIAWFVTQVVYGKITDLEKQQVCTVGRSEWAARNVYVDNQIERLRAEQREEFKQLRNEKTTEFRIVNEKLDKITDHLLSGTRKGGKYD